MTSASGSERGGASRINELRGTIDKLDAEILDLLNQRLQIARQIGEIKQDIRTEVVDRQREHQVLDRLSALNSGPLGQEDLRRIFHAVISAARNIQIPHRAHLQLPSLFGVIGDPIAHSVSPVMHGRAFAYIGFNGIYLAFQVKDLPGATAGIRALGLKGVSVTIPHKVAVMELIDEVDETARRIGAVNTVVNRDGQLWGCNTDCPGAVRALTEKTSLRDKRVVILGAGGAARAVGFGIRAEGGRVVIANRTPKRGEILARDLDSEFVPLEDLRSLDCDILINTTPVGMHPQVDDTPLSKDLLHRDMVVMDAVFNPLQTRLLKDAQACGCTTVDGATMLVYQGAEQFELWTGEQAPVEVMRQAVLEALRPGGIG
jgi:shikimate dehydrogenase